MKDRRRIDGLIFVVIVTTAAVIPLQDHLPAIRGFSVAYLAFAALSIIAAVTRHRSLFRIARRPEFVGMAVFILMGAAIETLHANSDYRFLSRVAQMAVAGVVIGAFARRPRFTRAVLTGVALAGLWVSALLIVRVRPMLAAAYASTFEQAGVMRLRSWTEMGFRADSNSMALFTGCAAVVMLACSICAPSRIKVALGLLMFGICSTATFLTMSRAGMIMLAAGIAVVLVTSRIRIVAAGTVLLFTVAWLILTVPSAVYARMSFGNRAVLNAWLDAATQTGVQPAPGSESSTPVKTPPPPRLSTRSRLMLAFVSNFREFAWIGIGEGNWRDGWALTHGFQKRGIAYGAHNCFLQVWIFWGVTAFLALSTVAVLAWRDLRGDAATAADIAVKAISAMLLLRMLASHTLYGKEYSIGLGLIAVYGLRRPLAAGVIGWRLKRLPFFSRRGVATSDRSRPGLPSRQ